MSRHPRFFASWLDPIAGKALISGKDHMHLKRVLRLGPRDLIVVSKDAGSLYHAEIVETTRNETWVHLLAPVNKSMESPLILTLIQALPKRKKFEWILQKATELGVTRIIPIVSEHCVPHFSEEKKERKRERWNQILKEAAKQSYRGVIPQLGTLTSLSEAIGQTASLKILCTPDSEQSLRQCLYEVREITNVAVAIGPEGGFSPSEIALARTMGAKTCSLGPRILRLETAVVKVLGILQFLFGDG